MTAPDLSTMAAGLSEAQELCEDLTSNWDAFCDADPLPHRRENYPEDLERLGYAELVPVDADALDSSFAWERGIVPGGSMWQLTPLGLALRAHLQEHKS